MSRHLKDRKLSKKEKMDIDTMIYFLPKSSVNVRIYPNDKKKMANMSSQGIKPKKITKGYELLRHGKTFRDMQITSYQSDIRAGLFTKHELVQSMPPRLRGWLLAKISNTPYDESHTTSDMLIKMYRSIEK